MPQNPHGRKVRLCRPCRDAYPVLMMRCPRCGEPTHKTLLFNESGLRDPRLKQAPL